MACLEDEMPRFAANLHCMLGYGLFEHALNYVQRQFHLPSESPGEADASSTASLAAVTDESVSMASQTAGQFYEALCLLLSGHLEQAMGRLNRLLDNVDYSLAASTCLLHIHRDLQCTTTASASSIATDLERVARYTKSATLLDLYYTAIATLYCGAGNVPYTTALEYVKKHLSGNSQSMAGKWLKAHILLAASTSNATTLTGESNTLTVDDETEDQSTHNSGLVDEPARLFQEIITKQSKPEDKDTKTLSQRNKTGLLALIGLAECYARRNDSKRLAETIARFTSDLNAGTEDSSNFLALRLLKLRSFLINHDWESAVETANNVSNDESAVNDDTTSTPKTKTDNTVLGELVTALSHLCYYARVDDFHSSVDRLFGLIRAHEPNNVRFRAWLVHLLSRLVPDPEFVRKTRAFLCECLFGDDAEKLSADELSNRLRQATASVDQLFELAHQFRLLRETSNALAVVKEIMRRLQIVSTAQADDNEQTDEEVANINTIMTYAEILLDAAEYASQQVEKKNVAYGKRTASDSQSSKSRTRAVAEVPSSPGGGDADNKITQVFYFEQAEQQFDFLEQLILSTKHTKDVEGVANSPRYNFLKARMALKRSAATTTQDDESDSSSQHHNTEFVHALSLLNKAAHRHVNMLQNMAFGIEFLYALDAEFITAMIRTMLRVVGTGKQYRNLTSSRQSAKKLDENSRHNNNYANAVVQQAEHLLEQIYKALPTAANTKISFNEQPNENSASAAMLLPDLQFMMARVLYMRGGGKENQAINLLLRVIEQHPNHEEAALLVARITCNQQKFKHCLSMLEPALAHNFALPQRVEYWIVTAQANVGLKNMAAARDSCAKAVRLLDTLSAWPRLAGILQHQETAVQDFHLVLELICACTSCGDIITARTLLEQAKMSLGGQQTSSSSQLNELLTLAEARILMNNSTQADEVLKLLRSLDTDSDLHEQALELTGNVLLNMKHDEKGFVELYQREFQTLTSSSKTDLNTRVQAHIMLSNAYMRLPAPERAIQALEAAVKMDAKNVQLITHLGLLYTRCHYFKKAVNYYELSVKRGNDELLPELVQLLVDMNNYERARQVIDEFNERVFSAASGKDASNVAADAEKSAGSKKLSVELHVISAKLFVMKSIIFKRANEDWGSAKECLMKAKEEFVYALKRAGRERPDLEQTISKLFVDTCCELCEQYLLREHLFQEAKAVFSEALEITAPSGIPGDDRIMLGMVRALIGLRDISQAQRFINTSFSGSSNDNSTQVLALTAEIYFLRHDVPQVISVANGILATSPPARPPDAAVLVTVIDLLFRSGHLPTSINATMRALDGLAQKYLHYHAQQQEFEAGLSFCRALLHRLAGNDDAAEQLFKSLLIIPQWAAHAAIQLTFCVLKWSVYMPSFDLTAIQSASPNEQVDDRATSARPKTRAGTATTVQLDKPAATPSGNMAVKLTNDEVIILRQMLLKSLPADLLALSPTYAVYALLPLVYSTDQKNVTEFYHAVSAMRERWPKSVAPMWAVATCLRLFGRDREAHALLKTTLSLPWNIEEADMLERCWMMLIAETNLSDATASSSASAPVASPATNSILDKCLRYNQNCYFANLLLAQQIERDVANAGGPSQRLNASKTSLTREKPHEHQEFNTQLQMAVDRYEAAFRVSAGKDAFSGVKLVKAALERGHAERAMETLVMLMQNESEIGGREIGGASEANALLYRELMRSCADIFRT